MKKIKERALILGTSCLLALAGGVSAKDLVILHTNDTHSQIDPAADGMGGVLQRKAIIDSVRKAEKNVVLVDAGDAVQGSLYFKFFKGDVEYPLMDMMGYDIRILGNHEFDNGMEDLARYYRATKGKRLSANYDFSGTALEGVFEPYTIRKIGGKKIGFIGLNIDPESIIAKANIDVKFKDVIPTANDLASYLKKEKGCDLVVAVTHIGYVKENEKTTDVDLAKASHDIDIIIGGHSHTLIDPEHPEKYPHLIKNADGRPVLVVQTGKSGKYLGSIKIDLDDLKEDTPEDFEYELIPVTDRFPSASHDKKIKAFLEPFREKVDSVNSRVIAHSAADLNNSRTGGFANWTADFADWYGRLKTDSLRAAGVDIAPFDFGIMNVGGIRAKMPKGDVTEGQILSTFPFSNHMVITRLKGSDIIDAMKVAARKGGEAVSSQVRVVTDPDGNLVRVVYNNKPLDPEQYYNVCTIDYLAWGNDDLTGLGKGEWLWRDDPEMSAPMMRYVNLQSELGLPINPDPTSRFVRMEK